jgi:hypothetical protein
MMRSAVENRWVTVLPLFQGNDHMAQKQDRVCPECESAQVGRIFNVTTLRPTDPIEPRIDKVLYRCEACHHQWSELQDVKKQCT